ncbi:MAG: hypothetical protein R2798_09600 [Chitinophagales bacterium]|nr:hypothetical protein [Bacteroidota bacterium]
MKKITCLFIVLFAAMGLQAQTEQGSLMLGGNLGFSSSSVKDVDGAVTDFSISPTVGYFVIDNLALGAGFSYVSSKNTLGGADATASAFGFGPFVRYYLENRLFGQLGFDLLSSKANDGDAVNGTWITPRIGYAAFLNDYVSIEPSVYYSIGGGDLYKDWSQFGLSVGFNIYLH